MRVLICGHRGFTDSARMEQELSRFNITEVIEGEARGADTLARLWAERRGIPVHKFPAKWSAYGRAAGPIRNKEMLTVGKPEMVIAFLAPDSKGTANMIAQARNMDVPIEVIAI